MLDGGSLQMWKRYFGPFATIVGIDISPQCKAFEEPQMAMFWDTPAPEIQSE